MAKFIPSKFQVKIFETYRNTNSNIVVSAVPGSGKTSTILELLKLKKANRNALFVAFNSSIVKELALKTPQGIDVMTLHSFGCKVIYRHFKGKAELNNYKLYRIAKQIEKTFTVINKKQSEVYIWNLIKIVDLYRLRLESSFDAIQSIIDNYGIDTLGNELNDSVKLFNAYKAYNSSWDKKDKKFMMDYTDMVYLPAIKNWDIPMYDDVFIDESQDLNAVQQKLIDKIIKPKTGRFVAVGDPRQSIYGFMGADVYSYNNFLQKKNTIELPLSFSYRCGSKIVEKANEVWNVILSPEQMFEGEIIEHAKISDVKEGDFVLCRNNKPLVEQYFKFMQNEIPCYINGSEIGRGILLLIKVFENTPKEVMLKHLEGLLSNVYNELVRKNIKSPTRNEKYVSLSEKIGIINIIANNYDTTKQICDAITKMFQDESKGIMLSSIHKSKGMEADNVFILQRELIPSPYAIFAHQIVQENNLLYVAITRARKVLGFI